MLKRKIYDYLLAWKKEKGNECLLVNGARQVGKTYIVEYFGKQNYRSYIYLNFIKNPEYKRIFEGSLDPLEIRRRLSLFISEYHYVEGDTLLFIDEIQACKQARTALKFLAMEEGLDVIASGSLLGIHYDDSDDNVSEESSTYSIPVGYEHEIHMYSLDFEEYLWAKGISGDAIAALKEHFLSGEKIAPGINEYYLDLLHEFLIVGGMPAVVTKLLETNNYQDVHSAQEAILQAYRKDIGKYARNTDKPKIRNVYESIPRQLAKEYVKFQYKTVERNGSARKYENCIDWLVDAGLICTVKNVSLPQMPLAAYELPSEFKVFATDIGLATCMFGFETQIALRENTLKGPAKGGIYENLIFDILHKKGLQIRYYKKDDSSQELEFLLERDGCVIPIEVKSSNGATVSLDDFIERYNPPYVYKLISGNMGINLPKITAPLYLAIFI